jgi:predicted 3-demethylubiquinone-9 3-methyltransferase (glyoxalase superfamily)
VSWQIVPKVPYRLLSSDDQASNDRVMEPLLEIHKLDIGELEGAASRG